MHVGCVMCTVVRRVCCVLGSCVTGYLERSENDSLSWFPPSRYKDLGPLLSGQAACSGTRTLDAQLMM